MGRLLISRGERGAGASVSGDVAGAAVGGRGVHRTLPAAFLTGAALGAAELDADETVFLAGADVPAGAARRRRSRGRGRQGRR